MVVHNGIEGYFDTTIDTAELKQENYFFFKKLTSCAGYGTVTINNKITGFTHF